MKRIPCAPKEGGGVHLYLSFCGLLDKIKKPKKWEKKSKKKKRKKKKLKEQTDIILINIVSSFLF